MDARLLLDLGRQVTGTLDLQEILERSLAGLRQLTGCDGGLIQLVHDGVLIPVAAVPELSGDAASRRPRVGEPISGLVAATGEPIYIADLETDATSPEAARDHATATGLHTSFGAPLIMSGGPLGVVTLQARSVDAFDEQTRETVLAFVPTIAAAVVQSRAFTRQSTALARVRMASDAITQGLAVAKYAIDAGQDDMSREAIEDTLRRSREVITELLGDSPQPGELRRPRQ